MSGPEKGPVLDVDRIVADLRERVAARRARGDYDEGLVAARFDVGDAAPGTVVLRPGTAYSSKPVLGKAITFGKQAMIRGLYHFLDDLVAQTNAALAQGRAALEAEGRAREAAEDQVRGMEREVADLRERLRRLEEAAGARAGDPGRLSALEGLRAGERLAALERAARAAAQVGAPPAPAPAPDVARLAAVPLPVDDAGPERLAAYVAHLEAPVLDLAPEAGLLAALADAGVAASGPAEGADPLADLATREPDALGGIAALGVGDRLGLGGWLTLADLAATRLRPGGGLVLEMLNPLTPAGLALRMRDPTLAPPVHPETVAWLLRAAGLVEVEVRTLGAFPDAERVPLEDPPEDADAERYNRIAHHVNRATVGEPLVAVLARR